MRPRFDFAAPAQNAVLTAVVLFPLLWIFAAFVVTQGVFALGFSLRSGWVWWGAAWLLALAGTAVLFPDGGKRNAALAGGASALVWLLFCGVAVFVHDFSYDGQAYHQEAIIRLAQGWNPMNAPLTAGDTNQYQWLNGYPKITWQTGALSFAIWNRIETAKSAMWLLGTSVSALTALWVHSLAKRSAAPRFVWAIGILALCNPVAVTQVATFQLDGYIYWGLIGVALGAAGVVFPRASPVRESVSWTIFAVCALILAAAKFTGIVYAVYAVLILGAVLLVRREPLAFRIAPVLLAAAAVALVCLWHPYAHNVSRYGHPLYPVMGKGATDIIGYAEHPRFVEQNRFVKFFWANNARARNIAGFRTIADNEKYGKPLWKLPFALYRSEIAPYVAPDVHIGGFGPWYGGSLIAATVLLFVCVMRKTQGAGLALGVWAIVGGSVFVNPEAWWVRYSPQGWWLVLIPLAATVVAPRPLRTGGIVLGALLFVNVLFVGAINTAGQIVCERSYSRQNALLRAASPGSWFIAWGNARSNRRRFAEEGIAFRVAPDTVTTAQGWFSVKLARTDTVVWTRDETLARAIIATSPRGGAD
ncbi:MAG: hypothetical protein H7Y38_02525 [Armatimonadetes bacterium]|nr:hypothetical protein [Armatimonadota bacterium]